jgi:transcriptional regulator with GAF, ATPase, and Fis domain
MPLDTQAKLLRVLENRSILRLGGIREIAVDARIVYATHRDRKPKSPLS